MKLRTTKADERTNKNIMRKKENQCSFYSRKRVKNLFKSHVLSAATTIASDRSLKIFNFFVTMAVAAALALAVATSLALAMATTVALAMATALALTLKVAAAVTLTIAVAVTAALALEVAAALTLAVASAVASLIYFKSSWLSVYRVTQKSNDIKSTGWTNGLTFLTID